VLTDARPAVLFVAASYSVVLADAQPSTLLALASYALVLAGTKVAKLFAAPYVLHYHFTHNFTQTSVMFRL
jgi:membrane protein YdbS with pleckstrin-like domain